VERLQFSDTNLALDFQPGQNSYMAVKAIAAAFGAESIDTYFGAAVSLFDSGMSMADISNLVIDYNVNPEINAADNTEFVSYVYKNATGVDPNLFQILPYVIPLDEGLITRAELLRVAAESSIIDTQLDLIGWRESGLEYHPLIS